VATADLPANTLLVAAKALCSTSLADGADGSIDPYLRTAGDGDSAALAPRAMLRLRRLPEAGRAAFFSLSSGAVPAGAQGTRAAHAHLLLSASLCRLGSLGSGQGLRSTAAIWPEWACRARSGRLGTAVCGGTGDSEPLLAAQHLCSRQRSCVPGRSSPAPVATQDFSVERE
jgi:hypothetical protein